MTTLICVFCYDRKNFKKNNVAVDVINFGAENSQNENAEKLEAFVAAINSNDNSHLVNVPPGPHVLADLVLTSSIMLDNPAAAAAAAAIGGAAAGGGGMDAGMDEDLAMAIRMSMEDERQRQEALNGGDAGAGAYGWGQHLVCDRACMARMAHMAHTLYISSTRSHPLAHIHSLTSIRSHPQLRNRPPPPSSPPPPTRKMRTWTKRTRTRFWHAPSHCPWQQRDGPATLATPATPATHLCTNAPTRQCANVRMCQNSSKSAACVHKHTHA